MDPNIYDKNPDIIFNDNFKCDVESLDFNILSQENDRMISTNETNFYDIYTLPDSIIENLAKDTMASNVEDASRNLEVQSTNILVPTSVDLPAGSNTGIVSKSETLIETSVVTLNEKLKSLNPEFTTINDYIDLMQEIMHEETQKNNTTNPQPIIHNITCYNNPRLHKLQKRYTNWVYQNPWVILLCLCLASVVCIMAGVGNLGVIVQEIEKHYGLSSIHSGFISACSDIMFCFLAIFIGWNSKNNRLPAISLGILAVTTGCFCFILPIMFSKNSTYVTTNILENTNQSLLPVNTMYKNKSNFTTNNNISGKSYYTTNSDSYRVLIIFYISFGFIGAGTAPILILSPVILKELLSEKKRSVYLSYFYLSSLIGLAISYVTSSPFLNIPVYLKTLKKNEKFIGAWWVCYVFTGVLSFVSFIFILINSLLFCPNKKNKNSLKNVNITLSTLKYSSNTRSSIYLHSGSSNQSEKLQISLKDIKESRKLQHSFTYRLKKLAFNHCYICMTLTSTFCQFLIVGFATFIPKFFENNYSISSSKSGMVVCCIIVPSALLGTIFGGAFIQRYKLVLRQICFFCLVLSLFSALAVFCFLIHCPSVTHVTPNYQMNPKLHNKFISTSNKCMAPYINKCDELPINPVCYEKQHILFLNPCYAGCKTKSTLNNKTSYINCTCLNDLSDEIVLEEGLCSMYCNNIFPFSFLMFLLNFFLFSMYVPVTEITIRVVNDNYLTMAVGLQQIVQRLLGQIPGPIIFGKLIDMACLLWNFSNSSSNCFIYDTHKYRMYLMSIAIIIMIINIPCTLFAYIKAASSSIEEQLV